MKLQVFLGSAVVILAAVLPVPAQSAVISEISLTFHQCLDMHEVRAKLDLRVDLNDPYDSALQVYIGLSFCDFCPWMASDGQLNVNNPTNIIIPTTKWGLKPVAKRDPFVSGFLYCADTHDFYSILDSNIPGLPTIPLDDTECSIAPAGSGEDPF